MILSEIAHDAFQENRLFLPRREIADKIENLLAEMLPDEKFINGVDVLKSIEVQHGVLVERADSIYSFSHLTLQEYLTAQYIDDHRQVEKLVTEHLTDKRWNEVFLLVAGLMRGGADDLLLSMEKEVQKYIKQPKLQALLNWAEQATTGSAGNFKPVAKRALAIAIAYIKPGILTYIDIKALGIALAITSTNTDAFFNVFNGAMAYARACADASDSVVADAINYTSMLEESKIFNNVNFTMLINELNKLKTKIPDDQQPQEARRTFVQSPFNSESLQVVKE